MSVLVDGKADGRVYRLELRDTESQNRFSRPLIAALLHHLQLADADASIGCVLISAVGPLFSPGIETSDLRQWNNDEMEQAEKLLSFSTWIRKPVVAAVQGPAMGAAVTLLANCHLVVIAQGCSFALPEIRSGSWPALGFGILQQILGPRRALSLSLLGRQFSSPEAIQFGLAHEMTPAFELEDRADALASYLSNLKPAALEFGLRQNQMQDLSIPHFRDLFRDA
jgi:enoyl-CoA hydratase/carnithine racemase